MEHLYKDNGAAVAHPCPYTNCQGEQVYATGLTKREHFAGLAMQGLLASECAESFYPPDKLAQRAIESADALLAALESPK